MTKDLKKSTAPSLLDNVCTCGTHYNECTVKASKCAEFNKHKKEAKMRTANGTGRIINENFKKMQTVKTKRDSLGAHHFDCNKCKKEGFLGFWQDLEKYPSPMKWSCSHCGEKIQLERTPYKEADR